MQTTSKKNHLRASVAINRPSAVQVFMFNTKHYKKGSNGQINDNSNPQ